MLVLLCFTFGGACCSEVLSLGFVSNDGGGTGPVGVAGGAGVGGVTDPVELVEHDDAVDSFRRSLWCDLLLPDPPLLGFSCFSCS